MLYILCARLLPFDLHTLPLAFGSMHPPTVMIHAYFIFSRRTWTDCSDGDMSASSALLVGPLITSYAHR